MARPIYTCPSCGYEDHSPGACPDCGTDLEETCAKCGNPVEECICEAGETEK